MFPIEQAACIANGNDPICYIETSAEFSYHCCPADTIDLDAITATGSDFFAGTDPCGDGGDFANDGVNACSNDQLGVADASVDTTTGTTSTITYCCASTIASSLYGVPRPRRS